MCDCYRMIPKKTKWRKTKQQSPRKTKRRRPRKLQTKRMSRYVYKAINFWFGIVKCIFIIQGATQPYASTATVLDNADKVNNVHRIHELTCTCNTLKSSWCLYPWCRLYMYTHMLTSICDSFL